MIHIIRYVGADFAACGEEFEEAVVLGGTAIDEANCKACCDECGVEPGAPGAGQDRIKYRYTITLLCDEQLSYKQREYLESTVESHIGYPANVHAEPEEVPVDENGDEV